MTRHESICTAGLVAESLICHKGPDTTQSAPPAPRNAFQTRLKGEGPLDRLITKQQGFRLLARPLAPHQKGNKGKSGLLPKCIRYVRRRNAGQMPLMGRKLRLTMCLANVSGARGRSTPLRSAHAPAQAEEQQHRPASHTPMCDASWLASIKAARAATRWSGLLFLSFAR